MCLKTSEGVSTLLPSCGSQGVFCLSLYSLFYSTLIYRPLSGGQWNLEALRRGVKHFLVLALEADVGAGRKQIVTAGTGIHWLHPTSCSWAHQPHCSHADTPGRIVYPSHNASLCCVCWSFGEDSGLDWTVGPRHMVNTKYERPIFGHEQALNMNRGLEQLWLWKSSPQIRSHIRENQNRIKLAAFSLQRLERHSWSLFFFNFFF